MESTNSIANGRGGCGRVPARHSRMALAALLLSFGAFLPPIGIVAVVLGHVSIRRVESGQGLLNGKAAARAALIIGYVQMFLVSAAFLIGWRVLHLTAKEFRRDALVQRMFRETDARQPLDEASAQEQEFTAQTLVYQLIAIQDQHYRSNGQGYLCSIQQLMETGLEGSTAAEKQALDERFRESPYIFELSNCNSKDGQVRANHFILTAVPRPPRMPANSMLFCANETGLVRKVRGGTSLDCLDHGEPLK